MKMADDKLEDISSRNLLRSFSKRAAVSKTPYPEPLQPKQLRSRRKSKMRRDSSFAETPRTLFRKVQKEKSNRRSSFFDADSKKQQIVSRHRSRASKQDNEGSRTSDTSEEEETEDTNKSLQVVSPRRSSAKSKVLPKRKSSRIGEEKQVLLDYFLTPKGVLPSPMKKTEDSKLKKKTEDSKLKKKTEDSKRQKETEDTKLRSSTRLAQVSNGEQSMKSKYVMSDTSTDESSSSDEEDAHSEIPNAISTQHLHENSQVQNLSFNEHNKKNLTDELSRYSARSRAKISSVPRTYKHFPRLLECCVKVTPLRIPKSRTVRLSQVWQLKRKSQKEHILSDASSDINSSSESELQSNKNASRSFHKVNRSSLVNLPSAQKNELSSEKYNSAFKLSGAELRSLPSTSKKLSGSTRQQRNERLSLQASAMQSKKSLSHFSILSQAVSPTFHDLSSGLISDDELADDKQADNDFIDDKQIDNVLIDDKQADNELDDDEELIEQNYSKHRLLTGNEKHGKQSHDKLVEQDFDDDDDELMVEGKEHDDQNYVKLVGSEEEINNDEIAVSQERLQAGVPSSSIAAAAPPPKKKYRKLERDGIPRMPDSFTCNILEFFSEMTVTRSCMPLINECLDEFWGQTLKTLDAHAKHAGRNRVTVQDIEVYLYRLRLCRDRNSLNALIEKYLPYDLRAKLIPMALSKHAKNVLDFDEDSDDN